MSKNGGTVFEVKLREKGDRVLANGQKVEGGKIFSRHYEANNPEHAKSRARKKFPKCNVVSITKVQKDDLIGDIKRMGLEKLIGGMPIPQRKRDVIVDNMTVDEFLFGNKKK